MNLQNQSIIGFVWSTVEKFGNRFLTLTIFFVLAKILDPESFGIVAIVNSIIAFVVIFVDQGFTTAVVQKEKLDDHYLNTAYWGNLGISLIFGCVMALLAPFVAAIFKDPNLTIYIRVISLSFLIGAVSRVQNALFIKEMKFKLLAIRRLIGTLAGGTVGIYMAFSDFGVWSLIAYQMVSVTTMSTVLILQSDWKPRFLFSWEHYKELLLFGVNVLGNNLLFYSQLQLVNLAIGYFLGTTSLGYYSIANKVFVTFKDVIINTFSRINLPLFAKLQNDIEERTKVFDNMTSKVIFIIFPISIGLAILSEDIVNVIFGPQWTESIRLMQILLFACAFTVIPSFCNDFLLGVGKPGFSFRLNLINALIYLCAIIIGLQFGLVETTIAVAISTILANPIALIIYGKVNPIPWKMLTNVHLRVGIASLLVGGVLIGLNYLIVESNYLFLALKSLALVITFILSVYLFNPNLFNEVRSKILQFIPLKTKLASKS